MTISSASYLAMPFLMKDGTALLIKGKGIPPFSLSVWLIHFSLEDLDRAFEARFFPTFRYARHLFEGFLPLSSGRGFCHEAFHELLQEAEFEGELISMNPGGKANKWTGGIVYLDKEGIIQ